MFGANVVPTLREESEYEEIIAEVADVEHCELLVAADEIEYYLGLCDNCVQIGVEDSDGMPRALVETDADEVRAWGERTYEEYRAQADDFAP